VRSVAGGGTLATVFVVLLLCSLSGVASVGATLPADSPAAQTAVDGDAFDRSTDGALPGRGATDRRALVSSTGGTRVDQTEPPENETNGTAVSHENPAVADRPSDLDRVANALANSMTRRLAGSTVELSQGQYQRARSLVGTGYDDQLAKYVDVAGPTGAGDAAESFRDARSNQRRFVNQTAAYWDTYDDYRDARRAGNEQRARRLARRLDEIARNVSRTGDRLDRNYQTIAGQTDADLNESRERVTELQRSVRQEQATVRQTEFVRTELVVDAANRRISFVDPLALRGRVRTNDGSAVADTTVRIRVANRTYAVETDSEGSFSLQHRPTTAPLGTRNLTVEYVPDTESRYRDANATVPVRVQQVTPSASISEAPPVTRFGQTVVVTGRVEAESVPASGVPVSVRLGDASLGSAETNDAGVFTVRRRLPATVGAGERTVTGTVELTDSALARTNATASVRVAPSDTNLTASLSRGGDDTILVSGRLTTVDGTQVPGQPVTLSVAGAPVADVRTGPRGTYRTTLSVSDLRSAADDGTTELVVSYDGAGTNLEPARASRSVDVGDPDTGGVVSSWIGLLVGDVSFGFLPLGGQSGSTALAAGVLVLVTLVGGTFYVGLRQVGSPDQYRDGDAAAHDSPAEHDADRTGAVPTLATATTHLSNDETDAAVIDAYLVARDRFERVYSLPGGTTHWQLYRALCDSASDEELSDFRRLVERYEYAAFGREATSAADAEAAVETARRLLERLPVEDEADDARVA
jgi:hypothetical protein